MELKVSKGNSKMGSITSVSLPSILTCVKDCDCQNKCYAHKIERLRPTVKKSYESNLTLLNSSPEIYWREVEASIMMNRYFRFHVSGDIPDNVYFAHMVEIADRNKHCEILCFTKKYNIINDYLELGGKLPPNLHIVFSAWRGYKMNNPFLLPEAHVRYKDGYTTASKSAKECAGNCARCVTTDGGCWSLKQGEQVVFNEH